MALSGFVSDHRKHFCIPITRGLYSTRIWKMYSFNTLRFYLWETIVFFRYAIFYTDYYPYGALGGSGRVERLTLPWPHQLGRGCRVLKALPFLSFPHPPPAGCLAGACRSQTVAARAAVCLFFAVCLPAALPAKLGPSAPSPLCSLPFTRLRT